MDNNREEFFHVILGPNSHFEYEYNDVKEIFARVDTFDYPDFIYVRTKVILIMCTQCYLTELKMNMALLII